MRNWIFLLVLTFCPLAMWAQLEAYFETTIYLEDAIGNKDSLIVGFDEAANSIYNPEFGEVDITAPWDSIFEARAIHESRFNPNFFGLLDSSVVLSKKIIGDNRIGFNLIHDCLWFNEPIVLAVSTQNLPLTISWDKSRFDSDFCLIGSTLATHTLQASIGPWEWWYDSDPDVAPNTICMAEDSVYETSMFNVGPIGDFYMIDSIQGIGYDTIRTILLYWGHENDNLSPCKASIVSTEEVQAQPSVLVYPNPTDGRVHIDAAFILKEWCVYASDGALLQSGQGTRIDLSPFPNGVYYLRIFDGRRYYTEKVVKME